MARVDVMYVFPFLCITIASFFRLQSSGARVSWNDARLHNYAHNERESCFCTAVLHELRVSTVTLCVITALSFAAALLVAANSTWREASSLSLAQGQ